MPLLPQVRQQLAHVVAQPLDLAMLRGVDARDAEVHAHAVVREHAGHFAADDDVGPIGEAERAADLVVVGDRDEIHAARLGQRGTRAPACCTTRA